MCGCEGRRARNWVTFFVTAGGEEEMKRHFLRYFNVEYCDDTHGGGLQQ